MSSFLSNRDAFFKDLKFQIKRGDLRVPNHKKSIIGAAIAQAEFGDVVETSGVVYPAFYPEPQWNTGIAHIIAKEHKKLKGRLASVYCAQRK